MSEYDVFTACLPMIAEMTIRCRRMDKQEFDEWKRKVMESADNVVKEFVEKVLICITISLTKRDDVCNMS